MINIGVFPSGSEVALEIVRALKYVKDINLIGLGSVDDYGEVAFDTNISDLPFIGDSDFVKSIANCVEAYGIKFLVPAMDEVAYVLKINEQELNCEVIYASTEVAEIIRRKSSTYHHFNNYFPTPTVYHPNTFASDIKFPIFRKPDIGYGSRGAQKISSFRELNFLREQSFDDYIYMEYLPGDELTIDCFSNTEKELVFVGPRRRTRTRMGISVSTSPVDLTDEILMFAKIISEQLAMTGCWFFQLKKSSKGEFKLLEIASRVSGSMAMYRLLGINFILLDIYQRLGKPILIPEVLPGGFHLERALDVKLVGSLNFDSVYIDLDDCLILDNKINTDLVAFIYGCRNKHIPVILITRHAAELSDTLSKFAIEALFDDIFHITNGSPKSAFIKHDCPLFVDDSFTERQEVFLSRNCHVAAPDMVHMELLK